MAETYTLDAQTRTVVGKKVRQLRVQGLIPAVIYGRNRQPLHVQIPARALYFTLLKAGGTHVINVNVDGTPQTVIAREVQRDVLRGDILHVDFLAIDANTRITAEVRVHFINESPAVASRQGILVTGGGYLSIEALPVNLPERIEIDLSRLAVVGDSLHVRDLELGGNLRILNDEDEMIVRVAPATTAEEIDTPLEAVSAEPEVISKGKADEEDEE